MDILFGDVMRFLQHSDPGRRIQNFTVAESADELERVLGDLDLRRKAELPRAQMIDRARLDTIGGVGEKAVHQGITQRQSGHLTHRILGHFADGIRADWTNEI